MKPTLHKVDETMFCIFLVFVGAASALSFAAEISEKNLDCELKSSSNDSSKLLSGSLFGMAQRPDQIGWFAASFEVSAAKTVAIKPISAKRYPYIVVGGLSSEPINRRLAVVRDGGVDIFDFVDNTLLTEVSYPACFNDSISELAYDASSGKLYGLAWTTLSNDGATCTSANKRELLIEIDFVANKLNVVAETPVCAIGVGVSAIDFVNSRYLFFGYECTGSGNMSFTNDGTFYSVDLAGDAAPGKAVVTKLPQPSFRVGLIKFALTQTARTGQFYVFAHANPPSYDWSLCKFNPTTGAVEQLSNAVKYGALILNAPSTIDGPNDIFIIQPADGMTATPTGVSLDVLSLTDGSRKVNLPIVSISDLALNASGTLSGIGTIELAPECVCCVKNGGGDAPAPAPQGQTTQAAPATQATQQASPSPAPVASNTTTVPLVTAPVGSPAPVPETSGASTGSTSASTAASTATFSPVPTPGSIRKRAIAPLNESRVKSCGASQPSSAAAQQLAVASLAAAALSIAIFH